MKSCNRAIAVYLCVLFGCAADNGNNPLEVQSTTPCSAGCLVSPQAPTGSPDAFTRWSPTTMIDGSAGVLWAGGTWTVSLPAVAGDVVSSVVVPVRDNGPADLSTVTATLISTVSGHAVTLGSAVSQGDGQIEAVEIAVPRHTVVTGETLTVQFDCMTGGINPQPSVINALAGTLRVVTPRAGVQGTIQITPIAAGSPAWNATLASGGIVTPLPMTNGSLITGLRARIADVPGMTFTLSLQNVIDGVVSTVATSAASAGNGSKQTLSVSGIAATVASGVNYQAVLTRISGSGLGAVYWFEVDTQ